jgi:hypothetical protein
MKRLQLRVYAGTVRVQLGGRERLLTAGDRWNLHPAALGDPYPAATGAELPPIDSGALRLRARSLRPATTAAELGERQRRILESLGYVGG